MRLWTVIILAYTVLYGACAHYTDVVAGNNGIHEVTATPDADDDDPDDDELSRDALNQAADFCEEHFKLKPTILSAKKLPMLDADRSIYKVVVKFKCR
jgi:hypothetical protein